MYTFLIILVFILEKQKIICDNADSCITFLYHSKYYIVRKMFALKDCRIKRLLTIFLKAFKVGIKRKKSFCTKRRFFNSNLD